MHWKIQQLMQYLEPGIEELDYETYVAPMDVMIEVEDTSIREDNPNRFRPLDHVEKQFAFEDDPERWYVARQGETDPIDEINNLKFRIHEVVIVIG